MLTLHDDVDAQRAYADLHNKVPFKPWSHFGDYRHNYEKVVPHPQVLLGCNVLH